MNPSLQILYHSATYQFAEPTVLNVINVAENTLVTWSGLGIRNYFVFFWKTELQCFILSILSTTRAKYFKLNYFKGKKQNGIKKLMLEKIIFFHTMQI